MDVDGLYGQLLGRPVTHAREQRRAQALYAKLVETSSTDQDAQFWQHGLRGQIYLGDEAFAERMREQATVVQRAAKAIPKVQRRGPKTWQQCVEQCEGDRDRALWLAYRTGGLTMTALADLAGISKSHVSRLIRAVEQDSAVRAS